MTEKRLSTLTILLPALNEEDGIGEVIDSVPFAALRAAGFEVRVLVVDGHSTDKTREIAAGRGADVVVQAGRGKGLGVRMGFSLINSDFIVMMDADGTYPTTAIPIFAERLRNGADVVIGSRFAGGIEEGAMSNVNMLGNRILTFLASILYGSKTTDVCTGMWGLNRKAIETLRLNSTGFELEAELFAQASKANLAMREVPVRYSKRRGTPKLSSLRSGIQIGLKLLRKKFVR